MNEEQEIWPVALSEAAVEMIKVVAEKENLSEHILRVSIRGGGCSGFMYGLDFDEVQKEGDIIFNQSDIKIFVDPISADYLHGTTIDYITGLHGSGFKFHNPKAVGTCGCGSSFSG